MRDFLVLPQIFYRRSLSFCLNSLGFFHFVSSLPEGTKGGIVFAWKPGVDVDVVCLYKNSIHDLVYSDPPNMPWLLSSVYGPTKWHKKPFFWRSLNIWQILSMAHDFA